MSEQAWTCTRAQMVAALAAIEIRPVLLPGREKRAVPAELMADAILEELPGLPGGAALIAAERRRQVTEEGYTPGHDAEHDAGQLARAAACYATPAASRNTASFAANVSAGRGSWYQDIPADWPWHPGYWKPGDRLRELVKAGALIAAEIDRLSAAAGVQ